MGIGPAFAIPKVLERVGISKDDVDLFEINEAFATMVCSFALARAPSSADGTAISMSIVSTSWVSTSTRSTCMEALLLLGELDITTEIYGVDLMVVSAVQSSSRGHRREAGSDRP